MGLAMEIFKATPNTNCKECGCPTCMTFALHVAKNTAQISQCPYISNNDIAKFKQEVDHVVSGVAVSSRNKKSALVHDNVSIVAERLSSQRVNIANMASSGKKDVQPDTTGKGIIDLKGVLYDISIISSVTLTKLDRLELIKLWTEYNPDYKSDFAKTLEEYLNKYWFEIGSLLPAPKPDIRESHKWTYAAKKRSFFSVSYINEKGDASVKWEFRKDFNSDSGYGKGETNISLAEDIMPVIRKLSQRAPKTKAKKRKEFLGFLLGLAVDVASGSGIDNDDTRETPDEMQSELQSLCDDYDSKYGKVNKPFNSVAEYFENLCEETAIRTRELVATNEARMKKREEFLKKYAGKSLLTVSVGGEIKNYLEGHCGFDIFAKKQEIDRELNLYKKNRSSKINSEKAALVEDITSEFYEKNLLSASSLSNSEKIKEYSDLRDFCCKYIPALGDRDFNIESIHDNYPDAVSKEACNAFKENWIRIIREYSGLSRGANGENKVYEVLQLFDDRARILREYVIDKYEHDFIVITPYGISTVEVKNLRGDYELTETGILKCLTNDKIAPKDVALQSKKHVETLRRSLKGCSDFSSNVPLQEIICSAEPNFTIKDNYHYIPVCYYNTVDKFIFTENKTEVLSEEAMDEIAKYLQENKQEAFKFDVFLPDGEIDSRDKFIKNFADVASGFIAAQNA